MKGLFDSWREIERILGGQRLFLFLDFDGTLAPIMARPGMVRLRTPQRETLRALTKCKDIRAAIISGRELRDVKNRLGVRDILIAGNHGLEFEGPKIRHVHPAATQFRRLLAKLVPRLKEAFAFLPEVLVEDKSYAVSVHYRQVAEDKVEFVKMLLLKEIGSYLGRSQVILSEGKKVWEIRPPTEWNKGKMVLWLLGREIAFAGPKVLPVYVGDDLTDEDAFRVLKGHGLTVKVTEKADEDSAADYRLGSVRDVYTFLGHLVTRSLAGSGKAASRG